MSVRQGLTFGIYSLSAAGTPTGLAAGPEDEYGRIKEAIQALLDEGSIIFTRNYIVYAGPNLKKGILRGAIYSLGMICFRI